MSNSARRASTTVAGPQREANGRSIRLMVAAMACFIVNDSLVKLASESLPAGQLIFVRGLIATALVLVVMKATGAPLQLRGLAGGWVAGRAALDALASLTYLISLFHLPIANATAINMATPLVITVLAVLLGVARVGPGRWAVITLGFAGVLLVIQPQPDAFNAFAWLCLLSTVLHAARDMATLRISRQTPSIIVTLATAVAVTLLAGALSLVQGWAPMRTAQLALLATAAVFLAGGYQLIIAATRTGDLTVVAPFRYTGLLMAVLLGWVVWGDVPNALAWLGIALVLCSGLYLLRNAGP
jgi:drug/metabolite transporter (DMT)-like permease